MKIKGYILSVDPGFRHTGYVVYSLALKKIVASGCLHTAPIKGVRVAESNYRAIQFTLDGLRTITDTYTVSKVAAELQVGSSKSQKAASAMGMSFATIVSFCCVSKLPLVPITPNEVKRKVSSSGSVPKDKVIAKFCKTFGKDWLSKRKGGHEHIADAGMVLLCFLEKLNEPR